MQTKVLCVADLRDRHVDDLQLVGGGEGTVWNDVSN